VIGLHATAWVNIDEPRLGASPHGTDYVTAPLSYLPLHGRNYKKWFSSKNRDERYDYLYTPEELEPIAESLKTMAKKVEREPTRRKVKKVIAATNNHYKGQAAVNAIGSKEVARCQEQSHSRRTPEGLGADRGDPSAPLAPNI
jgi:uncharacterized protein YecE (DUF72 family)